MRRRTAAPESAESPFGLSIGDLMAALLLIFILLLSATWLQLHEQFRVKEAQATEIKRLVEEYKNIHEDLYRALYDEFRDNLAEWRAVLDPELLVFRFEEPDVFFDRGQADIRPQFQEILDDFFPRYIATLRLERFRERIDEVRIEGHTSSRWEGEPDLRRAYFLNMELSQERTRKVLEHVMTGLSGTPGEDWTRRKVTANGLSSSRTLPADGVEDAELSRRVEFRALLDLSRRIANRERFGVRNPKHASGVGGEIGDEPRP